MSFVVYGDDDEDDDDGDDNANNCSDMRIVNCV